MSFQTEAGPTGGTPQAQADNDPPGPGVPSAEPQLSIDQALLLGTLHGPAELLPISSSGHVAVIPWLLGPPPPC